MPKLRRRTAGRNLQSTAVQDQGSVTMQPGSNEESVDYVSTSQIDLDSVAFIWSIKNFGRLANGVPFKSPEYLGGLKSNHSWHLTVTPNVLNKNDPNDKMKRLSVFLILSKIGNVGQNSVNKCVRGSVFINLLNTADELTFRRGSPTFISEFREGHEIGWCSYIDMDELLDPAKKFIINDTLRIHCRAVIECGFEHSITSVGLHSNSTKEVMNVRMLEQLRRDFNEGLETGAFTDMSLVTKTKTFKTHKFVLAARSPVFKAMLSSEMREAIQNSVEINDFDEETVERMLQFVYSGETSVLSADKACDLLRMADKYEVLGLKEYLEEFLGKKLSTSNVLKVLATAEMHGASQLKTTALHFTNKFKGVLQETEGFKELVQANPNLLNELYKLL